MIKIVCPKCNFSKELPSERLPVVGTMATCPKCACRFPVVAQPELPLVDSLPPPSSPPTAKPIPSFAIKVKFQGLAGRDNRFTGEGGIRVHGEYLEVTGRWRRPFAFGKRTERYRLTELRNVNRSGSVVNFVLPLNKGQWQAVLVCSHESTATALVNRLPVITDSTLFTFGQAQQELKSRLEQLPQGTPAVWCLLASNILLYLMVGFGSGSWVQFSPDYLAGMGGNFSPYTTGGEWWRLLTAMFLHGGLVHLLFNMYALYSFGLLAERLYGTRAFLGIYLLAGFAGSCGTLLASPGAVGIGASGAIFGIMGTLVAFLMTDREFLSEGSRRKLLTNFAIFAAYALANGFGKAGIDNAAHVGGVLTGLTLGWFTGSPLTFRQAGEEWINGRVAAGICLTLLGAGLAVAVAPNTGVDFRTHLAMVELTNELVERETSMAEEMKRLAAKGTGITPADVRQAVDHLRMVHSGYADRLTALQPNTPGLQARRDLLFSYVTIKQEGNALMAEGIEKNDSTLIEAATRKLAEAKALTEELSKPVDWR